MDCTERTFLLAAIKQALSRPDTNLEYFAAIVPTPGLSVLHFVCFDSGFVQGGEIGRQVGRQEEAHRDKRERRKREKRHKRTKERR